MAAYLIAGIVLLVGVLLILRWFTTADPKTLARGVIWAGVALFVVGVGFLAFTGRLQWVFMLAPALLPWFFRARAAARMAKNFSRMQDTWRGQSRTGRTSEVQTKCLRMTLDHDTGGVFGEVIAGPHAGRRLEDMERPEIVALWATCRSDDPPSAQLLETFLDRVHNGWRDEATSGTEAGSGTHTGGASGFAAGKMSRDEACRILGLKPGAGKEEIKAAHHRLMANLHPDRGGSDYLAAKINEARDVLLGEG
jgi:hypothetical protein